MQTKQNLRTGMMTLADGDDIQNRELKRPSAIVDNRNYGDEFWCMALPELGMRPEEGFYLRAQSVKVKLLTYYKLTRSEHSALRTECAGKRCQLVTLPPGVAPKDIGIQGK